MGVCEAQTVKKLTNCCLLGKSLTFTPPFPSSNQLRRGRCSATGKQPMELQSHWSPVLISTPWLLCFIEGGFGSELPSGSVSLSPILARVYVGRWQHMLECARDRHSSTFTPIHRHGVKMQGKGAPAQRWAPDPALCSCRQSLCVFAGSRIGPRVSFGRPASVRAGSSVRQVCIVPEHGRNSPGTVPEGPLANVPHPRCTCLICPETH